MDILKELEDGFQVWYSRLEVNLSFGSTGFVMEGEELYYNASNYMNFEFDRLDDNHIIYAKGSYGMIPLRKNLEILIDVSDDEAKERCREVAEAYQQVGAGTWILEDKVDWKEKLFSLE